MGKKLNLAGGRFHRLTVLSELPDRSKDGLVRWMCRCDCGAFVDVPGAQLVKGGTKSCGCLQKERARDNGKLGTKHGMTDTPLYYKWRAMLKRCEDSGSPQYKNYGGRGIKVCERWKTFANFYEDMGDPPDGLSLDRIDVNGNYEPGNCRWATSKQQSNNKRTNKMLEFDGELISVAQLAERVGIDRMTLYWRYNQGWTMPRLIQKPGTVR